MMVRCKLLFTLIGCSLSTLCQAGWTTSPPAPISTPYFTFTYASVSNSCDPTTGVFLAAWADGNNNQFPTYSIFTPDSGWSPIDTISNLSGALITTNVLTSCDPVSGKFLATWTDLTTHQPTSAVYTPGMGWSIADSLPTSVATGNTASTFNSMTGQFLVSWSDVSNDHFPTYSFYTLGSGWGPIATISTDSRTANVYTSFDPSSNRFLAVWVDVSTGNPMYSLYDSGIWSAAAPISPFASVDNDVLCTCDPSTGQFMATWADINLSFYPFYSVYTPGSGWSPMATITTHYGVRDNVAISCDLTTGQFLASWSDVLNGHPTYAFYTPGTGWGLPATISVFATSGSDIITSFNAMTGEFLATWADNHNLDQIFDPTYSFFTFVEPAKFGGSSSISTSSVNAPINIHAGGAFSMRTGTFSETSVVVNATADAVAILADEIIATSAATSNSESNANILINSGRDISLTGNAMHLTAGSATNSSVKVTTTNGGDIDLNSNGDVSLHGGSSCFQSTEVSLLALKGGDINITGEAVSFDAGRGANAPVQIMTGIVQGTGAITINGSSINATGTSRPSSKVVIAAGWTAEGTVDLDSTGGISLDSTRITTNAPLGVNPITVTAGDDIALTNSLVKTNLGNTSFFAGGSISLDSATQVNAGGNDALALFVIDDNNDVLSSGFTYPTGAQIIANKSIVGKGAVRIYTVTRDQNSVATGSNINGATYIPGIEFTDTNHEYWGISYPTVPAPSVGAPLPDGTDHFTIYYKAVP